MFRKTAIALVVLTLGTALVSADASARAAFRGGGFHRAGIHGGFARGGWHRAGWRGGGARVAWRRGGWGWRGPAVAAAGVGVGVGLANAAAWGNPGWGGGWNNGCTRWRQVWTASGWRVVPVNVCW